MRIKGVEVELRWGRRKRWAYMGRAGEGVADRVWAGNWAVGTVEPKREDGFGPVTGREDAYGLGVSWAGC